MFMGFIIHFYIIFGTNLLTQSPVPISVFTLFRVSKKRKIKRSPIDLKLHGTHFLEGKKPIRLGVHVRGPKRRPQGRGRAHPLWARPPPSWAPRGPPDVFLPPIYISIYPKNIRGHNRSGVPPPEASVATESQSRPVPAPCRRGQSFSGGHLHHPGALNDEEGVVLPRG